MEKRLLLMALVFGSFRSFAFEQADIDQYVYQLRTGGVAIICEETVNEVNEILTQVGRQVGIKGDMISMVGNGSQLNPYRYCILINRD